MANNSDQSGMQNSLRERKSEDPIPNGNGTVAGLDFGKHTAAGSHSDLDIVSVIPVGRVRYLVTFVAFCLFTFSYTLRTNISIAMIGMVSSRASQTTSFSAVASECGTTRVHETPKNEQSGPFDWSEQKQTLILSSFYWGYAASQIPAGRIADKFGARRLLSTCVILAGILSTLTPAAAYYDFRACIVVRILGGLLAGVNYPSMQALMARWAPTHERSFLVSAVSVGSQTGAMLSFPLAGLITHSLGWEFVFYIMGGFAVVAGACAFFLLADSPATHPYISMEERKFIQASIGTKPTGKPPAIPWKSVFTSIPMWSLALSVLGFVWDNSIANNLTPIYIKNILHYDIKQVGYLTALPPLCQLVLGIFFSRMVDFARGKNYLPITKLRKLAVVIGQFGPALVLIMLANSGCNKSLSVVLLIMDSGLSSACFSAHLPTCIDMAPLFAGTLFACANFFGQIISIFNPIISGAIIDNDQTLSTWARVFYISAALNITTGTIFLVGGSSDPQPWREGTQSQHVYPMNTAAVTNPVYMKDNENAKTEENSTV